MLPLDKHLCVSLFGVLSQNAIDWVAYNQQTFISQQY